MSLEARSQQTTETVKRLMEQKLASAFRLSPDPSFFGIFPGAVCIEVNESFYKLFGYTREQVIGCKGKELEIWQDLEQCNHLAKLLVEQGAISNEEVDFRVAGGEVKTMLLSAELIEINGQQYVLATGRDITERKQAQMETRLLLEATQAISKAVNIDSAFSFILRLICQHINWDFGEVWIPSSDGRVLEYCLSWHGSQDGLAEFSSYSETITFSKELGLLGAVWESQEPQWLEDISQVSQTKFMRKEIALEVGLKSCFAVPILNDHEVLAVLMFFKSSTKSRDKHLLELVTAVAAQLGGLIKRKQAQTAHRQSEERLEFALKASDLGLWDWNIRDSKVYRDSRWKKMLGYEDWEIGEDALNLRRLIHPEDWEFIQQELKAYLQGKRPIYQVEFRMLCKNQEWKWIESRGQIFERDAAGKPLRMTGTHKDITERKQAEVVLQESERRFRAIFNSSFGFTALLQPNGEIISLNQTALDLFGLEEKEVVGLPFWECLGRQICCCQNNLQAIIERAANGEFIRNEVDIIDNHGNILTIDSSLKPIFDQDNRVVLLIVEGRDITQRKILEKQVTLREARLNAFFSSAPIGLSIVDRQLRYVQINELLAEINGASVEEHLGKTIQEIIPTIAPRIEKLYQQVLTTNQSILNIEISGASITQPSEIRDCLFSCFPIPGEDNVPTGVGAVLIEITALKRAETALREREEAFRAIFENAAVGIAQVSPDGKFFKVNQQFCQIVGYSKSQLLQLNCTQITHSDSLAEYLDYCNQLAQNQINVFSMEKALNRKNGEVIWTNLTASAIRETSGEIKYVIGVVEDISTRKNAEKEVSLATERLEYLLASSPAIIFSCLPSGNFDNTFISQNVYEIVGYQAQQFLSESGFWMSHVHPEDLPEVQKQLSQTIKKEYLSYEYRFLHSDGTYHWFSEQTRLIRDEKGYPLEYVGCWIDINEAKQTELELQLSQRRYQNLAEVCPVGIVNTDADGLCIYLNQHWTEITGLSTEESLGDIWIKVLHPDDREAFVKSWREAVKTKTSFTRDCRCLRPDGKVVWVMSKALPEIDENGEFKGYIATITDITDIKLAQEALQQAVIAADAANRAKSEFLANMSHELRTPLNAILGFSQLMTQDKTITEEHQNSLEIINRAGEHLLSLINDILEMSKIEAGRTSLNITDFDLHTFLDNLQEMLRFRASGKGLQLIFENATDIPHYIQSDASKLRQVLINLLGNAIKFTKKGSVKLSVRMGGQGDKEMERQGDGEMGGDKLEITSSAPKNRLIFEVMDTGIGIFPEEIELLFEAFNQTSAGRESQQGTGLGLAISRKYVQLMGGNITVESTPGVGSKFTFDIQLNVVSPPKIEVNQHNSQIIGLAASQIQYRILVVDDRPESRLLIIKMLSQLGFNVKEAANGLQAITLWEEWQPHLILMDMRMPTMDGYQATKIIKSRQEETISHSFIANKTIIIALTANAFEEQRNSIIKAGCDDLINKPFSKETLLEKLRKHLEIKYLYQQEDSNLQQQNIISTDKFTSDNLRQLLSQITPELVAQISHAAAQCSDNLIFEIIEEIPPQNTELTTVLKHFAENFQFDKILDAID
ncbi:MAG: PAS domain S-box protein [Nostocales cyanobacterium 94392]|nr:PAS domain S-box protein [Nostocales cyanobacterium 94392]